MILYINPEPQATLCEIINQNLFLNYNETGERAVDQCNIIGSMNHLSILNFQNSEHELCAISKASYTCIFSLPSYIKQLSKNKKQFKNALLQFLHLHLFYDTEEFF
jgi:hypothetical protein